MRKSIIEGYDKLQNDSGGVVSALEKAIRYVPGDQQHQYALLWCQLGHAYDILGQGGNAQRSFEECRAWEESIP